MEIANTHTFVRGLVKEIGDTLVTRKKEAIDYRAGERLEAELQEGFIKKLRGKFPDHGVIGEGNISIDKKLNSDYIWVMDILDGTKNFVSGKTEYGTSVTLLHKRNPVLNLYYAPEHKANGADCCWFETNEDAEGAYLNAQKMNLLECFHFVGRKGATEFRKRGKIGLYAPRTSLRECIGGIYTLLKTGGIVTDLNGDKVIPISESILNSREAIMPAIIATTSENDVQYFVKLLRRK